jgi:uncharacterized membrane protein YoaK (UPF0700 family)
VIWACLLALAFSWIPKRLVSVSLIFLLGFACGQVTAYRVLVHADRPATTAKVTAKAQRHSRRAAKKGARVAERSEKRQELEPVPRLWYLPVAGS